MKHTDREGNVAQLKLRLGYLQDSCAEYLEEYMHLVNCVCPNIEAQFMAQIGIHELRIFQAKAEIKRWKRRFEYVRQAIASGQPPNLIEIESRLDAELEAFMSKLQRTKERLDNAFSLLSMTKLTDSDTQTLRMLYLKAAKRLHPDVNPNLSPEAKQLWLRIQSAYKRKEWTELSFLVGLIDQTAPVAREFSTAKQLNEEIIRLEDKMTKLSTAIKTIKESHPYTLKSELDDVREIKQRKESMMAILNTLNETISNYKQRWERKEF